MCYLLLLKGEYAMLVILLTGVSGCGKDTVATELANLYVKDGLKVQVLHNADPAKDMLVKYFGVSNYKNDLGKNLIMGVTNLVYEVADFNYFEKKTMERVNVDTDVLIIPDYRYINTLQWWSSFEMYTVVSVLLKRGAEFLPKHYNLEVVEKEKKLINELTPNYIVNNKNAHAVAVHLKELLNANYMEG